MSMETQVTALAQAVGTDVKSLGTRIDNIPVSDTYTKAEIGDVTTDFVAAYTAAKQ